MCSHKAVDTITHIQAGLCIACKRKSEMCSYLFPLTSITIRFPHAPMSSGSFSIRFMRRESTPRHFKFSIFSVTLLIRLQSIFSIFKFASDAIQSPISSKRFSRRNTSWSFVHNPKLGWIFDNLFCSSFNTVRLLSCPNVGGSLSKLFWDAMKSVRLRRFPISSGSSSSWFSLTSKHVSFSK